MNMLDQKSTRAGQYIRQIAGYRAFIPKPLPPDPPLNLDQELLTLLSDADLALGRLDGAADILPDPELFVSMYVRKEAVLSSQIEGTQASLVDVLEYEANIEHRAFHRDVAETTNYVKAMNQGLSRLEDLPLSNRLLKEIHGTLLEGVRGEELSPGEFRRSQNWIGPPGCDLSTANFVPPPPHYMEQAMYDLEKYIHDPTPIPILLKSGLVHGQFETIHPFLDGNGRLGRLLITFLLCQRRVLHRPLLYLSAYFKQHQSEYYDRLQEIRTAGDWEGWLKFFLRGVRDVSGEATNTARRIITLRDHHRQIIMASIPNPNNGLALLDHLYEMPFTLVRMVENYLGVSYPTANALVGRLKELDILHQQGSRSRDRVFVYKDYVDILTEGTL